MVSMGLYGCSDELLSHNLTIIAKHLGLHDMAYNRFVYSRGSEHRGAPVAGGMGGISGGSATTGHMHVLQGSHTASEWDLLAESRANATLNSQSLQHRATS